MVGRVFAQIHPMPKCVLPAALLSKNSRHAIGRRCQLSVPNSRDFSLIDEPGMCFRYSYYFSAKAVCTGTAPSLQTGLQVTGIRLQEKPDNRGALQDNSRLLKAHSK
jgi:hypothetical protein